MKTSEIITVLENAKVHLEGGDPVEASSCLHLVMLHVDYSKCNEEQADIIRAIHKAHGEAECGDVEAAEDWLGDAIVELQDIPCAEFPSRTEQEIAAIIHEEKVNALIAVIWPRLDAGESSFSVRNDVNNVIDSWEPK